MAIAQWLNFYKYQCILGLDLDLAPIYTDIGKTDMRKKPFFGSFSNEYTTLTPSGNCLPHGINSKQFPEGVNIVYSPEKTRRNVVSLDTITALRHVNIT